MRHGLARAALGVQRPTGQDLPGQPEQLPGTRTITDLPFGNNEGLNIQQILELQNFELNGLKNDLSLKEKYEIYQTLTKKDPSLKNQLLKININT